MDGRASVSRGYVRFISLLFILLFLAGLAFELLLVLRFLPDWVGLGGAILMYAFAVILGIRLRTKTR